MLAHILIWGKRCDTQTIWLVVGKKDYTDDGRNMEKDLMIALPRKKSNSAPATPYAYRVWYRRESRVYFLSIRDRRLEKTPTP